MNKCKVAFFDVDGTILRSSLFIQVTDRLIETGAFPESVRREYADLEAKWLDRKGDYEAYIMAVVAAFMKHIKGISYSVLADVAEEIGNEQKSRIYQFTRDLVRD
ncbi:MAG TPA: hypothetical protein VJB98_03485, partial [Candidatus Paceibacterota bacterium]